jgi:hypothetical protein
MLKAASVDRRLLVFWFQLPRSFGSLRLNQKASPSPLTAWLTKLALLLVCVPRSYFLGCLFFHRMSFFLSSFTFWGTPLFSSEAFLLSPFVFSGMPFFIRGLFVNPFVFSGVPLFYQRSFCYAPLHFWGFLFFHRRSFC